MPLDPNELSRLEQEFASGRNPLAYIPLCQALRRGRNYQQALDVCLAGLRTDGSSVAGRTLLCRLYGDLGRYGDALRESDAALVDAPEAMGLLVERTRALIKLRRTDEAAESLDLLNRRNPLDPQVQLLNTMFKQLRGSRERAALATVSAAPRAQHLSNGEIARRLQEAIGNLAPVHSIAVIPLDAGEPAVLGEVGAAEASLLFCQEVSLAAIELDQGNLMLGVLETERRELLVALRRRLVIGLSTQTGGAFGKVLHRFQLFLTQLFPDGGASSRGASGERSR